MLKAKEIYWALSDIQCDFIHAVNNPQYYSTSAEVCQSFAPRLSFTFTCNNSESLKVLLPSSNRSSKTTKSKGDFLCHFVYSTQHFKKRWVQRWLNGICFFWNQTTLHKYLCLLAFKSPGVQERMQRGETDAFSHVLFTTLIPQPYKGRKQSLCLFYLSFKSTNR